MKIIETSWVWATGLSRRTSTDYIALHHAAAKTASAADVDRWHKGNGWSGIGYHYYVRKDGSIYRGRPEEALGAHVQGMNHCSIGICAEGDYSKETSMPEAQYRAIAELIADIKTRYPSAKVVGHREIGASDCPGRYYPLEELKAEKGEYIDMEQVKALQEQIAALQAELAAVKAQTTDKMIYNYIDENMPEWARPAVQWAVGKGLVQGTGEGLGLDDRDLRYLTILYRMH